MNSCASGAMPLFSIPESELAPLASTEPVMRTMTDRVTGITVGNMTPHLLDVRRSQDDCWVLRVAVRYTVAFVCI